MPRSPLMGRRIHIAGSISPDPLVASAEAVDAARDLVAELVKVLVKLGAGFVVPVDAEKLRPADGRPICFDWLVWQSLKDNLGHRPVGAVSPLAVAVQHHKSEDQIPQAMQGLWDDVRASALVTIENAAHWNMNSKRLEAGARSGDILVTLGGGEGVLFLANLYHECGKPVVPLNLPLCAPGEGSLRLFDYGLTKAGSGRLFGVREPPDPHGWINRINFTPRRTTADRVSGVVALLEALERPRAFIVRLLNPKHAEFQTVDDFFAVVVQPVVEDELDYKLTVVDGHQPYDHARIDQEIFNKLHRSGVVIADITGVRPNCFIELGYALGRGHPTLLTAKEGTENPFDTYTMPGFFWSGNGTVADRRRMFREYWTAAVGRPSLVAAGPLMP